MRVNDASEMHVVRLPRCVSRSLKFQRTQMKFAQQRAFDKGYVLNVFERNGFLNGEDDAFAKAQRFVAQLAFELVKIMLRPPLAYATKPDEGERQADDRDRHRESNRHNQIRANEGIEGSARGKALRNVRHTVLGRSQIFALACSGILRLGLSP
jgi:hypothetical protein